MVTRNATAVVLTISLSGVFAWNGGAGTNPVVAAQSAERPSHCDESVDRKASPEAEIEQRVRAFSDTLTRDGGGPDAYASFLHPSFTRWSHGTDGIEGRAAFLASVREWWDYGMRVAAGKSRIPGIHVEDDVAIVRVERSERFADGEGADAGSFHGFVTQVWTRHEGCWMLIGLDVSRSHE